MFLLLTLHYSFSHFGPFITYCRLLHSHSLSIPLTLLTGSTDLSLTNPAIPPHPYSHLPWIKCLTPTALNCFMRSSISYSTLSTRWLPSSLFPSLPDFIFLVTKLLDLQRIFKNLPHNHDYQYFHVVKPPSTASYLVKV